MHPPAFRRHTRYAVARAVVAGDVNRIPARAGRVVLSARGAAGQPEIVRAVVADWAAAVAHHPAAVTTWNTHPAPRRRKVRTPIPGRRDGG